MVKDRGRYPIATPSLQFPIVPSQAAKIMLSEERRPWVALLYDKVKFAFGAALRSGPVGVLRSFLFLLFRPNLPLVGACIETPTPGEVPRSAAAFLARRVCAEVCSSAPIFYSLVTWLLRFLGLQIRRRVRGSQSRMITSLLHWQEFIATQRPFNLADFKPG